MVSPLQRQYLDAMGIDVWQPRGSRGTPSVVAPANSYEIPAAGLPAWLADQPVADTSGYQPDIPLMIVGDFVAEQPAESLCAGESANLLDAMLKAIDINRDQILVINLAKNPGSDQTVSAVLNTRSVRVLLFMAALPVASDVESFVGHRTPGRHCCGAAMVASLHPHYLLANLAAKRVAWEDLKQVRSLLREA